MADDQGLASVLGLGANGFLGTTALLLAIGAITAGENEGFIVDHPALYSGLVIAASVVLFSFTFWQLVGIWRSASSYIAQGKPKVWGVLAMIAVVGGFLRSGDAFVATAWPQVAEHAQLLAGNDRFGTNQIRLLRDSTELEVSGAITFGLSRSGRCSRAIETASRPL